MSSSGTDTPLKHGVMEPSQSAEQPHVMSRFRKSKGGREPHTGLPPRVSSVQDPCPVTPHDTKSGGQVLYAMLSVSMTLLHRVTQFYHICVKPRMKRERPGKSGTAQSRKRENSNNWLNPPGEQAASWHCWHLEY